MRLGSRFTGAFVVKFFALLAAVIVLFPILWLIVSSFKNDKEVIAASPYFFPRTYTLMQYINVGSSIPLANMFRNSTVFAVTVTVISLLFDSLCGYAFARLNFYGKKLIFSIILITMMIPFQVIMTPLYIEEYRLSILDTLAGLVLPRATSAYGIYLMRSFFSKMPKSLEESSRIDGLSEFRIYWSIMLPQCKPALLSLGIFHLMNNWNDLIYPLMLTNSTNKRTLSAGLAILVGNKAVKYGPMLAATVISILPLLLVYVVFQKYFVEGIATSGTKE
ncbi:MAG: carbohydrate ABC transporter permease [Treponema sp.]|jgi:multiple sugar transport system permease protein|nr:carbohydrate ABC transporter permease [Treponema sp.]